MKLGRAASGCSFCHVLDNFEVQHFTLVEICFQEFTELIKDNCNTSVGSLFAQSIRYGKI
jgi:hypothetical protein